MFQEDSLIATLMDTTPHPTPTLKNPTLKATEVPLILCIFQEKNASVTSATFFSLMLLLIIFWMKISHFSHKEIFFFFKGGLPDIDAPL